ncbi:MAG TPA: type II toxin-antitoxin system VapC family toxin [Marmoricola sp.]|jgi:predicted nucleic acid-binding protein|nr:type II toxin-antitoxin system VapC family toxin [Marmoricola sp.]
MPVVDASVVVDWVAPSSDPQGSARRLLDALGSAGATVSVPPLLFEEVGNALLTGVRRDRWSGAEADRAFALLRSLPAVVLDTRPDLDRAWELSRRYDEHPLDDMVYLALAERLGQPLVTADRRLRERVLRPHQVVAPEAWASDSPGR